MSPKEWNVTLWLERQIPTSPKSAIKVPPDVQPKPSLAQFRTMSSHPVSGCPGRRGQSPCVSQHIQITMATTKAQLKCRVGLFHYLSNITGQQRHTGTWAVLGLVLPREETHTGAQDPLGSVHPSTQWWGDLLPAPDIKGLCTHAIYHKAVLLWYLTSSRKHVCECVVSTQEFYFSKPAEDEQH